MSIRYSFKFWLQIIGFIIFSLFSNKIFGQHDLALSSIVNIDSAGVGDTLIFELKLSNEINANIDNIQIKNVFPKGVSFVDFQPNSADFDSNTGIWTVSNMPSTQDSLLLKIRVEVDSMGLLFNTAEVIACDGVDMDSNPNNNMITEDDYTNSCVSVPILFGCEEEIDIDIEALAGLNEYQWYKDGDVLIGDTNSTLSISEIGHYTLLSSIESCEVGACCPILVMKSVCIGDTTFVDINGNGLQDNTDTPLANVTVTLYEATTGMKVTKNAFGNTVLPLLTNVNGQYRFDSLSPGQYFVEFDVTTAIDGNRYVPTKTNITGGILSETDSDLGIDYRSDTTSFLSYGQSDFTLDAGFLIPVSIGDTTFVDVNGNGLQDSEDSPLEGVTVTLFDAATGNPVSTNVNGNPINSILSDANGQYKFDSLYPAQYYVEFDVSTALNGSDYTNTKTNITYGTLVGNDSDIGSDYRSDTTAFLISGQMDVSLDAGFFIPVAVGDTTFVDNNGNGLQDILDSPLSGVTVTLYNATTGMVVSRNAYGFPVVPLITDNNGFYQFDSLFPGQYYVEFDVTTATNGNLYFPTLENVNGDLLAPNDNDLNNNFQSDTTAFLTSGQRDNTLDAGYYLPVAVGNLVWEDSNNDGLYNNGEFGVPNVEVILYQTGFDGMKATADDIGIDTIFTDVNGLYLFDSLFPADYYLKLNSGIPNGMISSTAVLNPTLNSEPANDPDDNINSDDNGTQMGNIIMSEVFNLTAGMEPDTDDDMDTSTNLSVDFGLFVPLSIGNLVWEDLDNNGQAEPNEPGIEGVEVILYAVGPDGQKNGGDDIEVASLTTNATGNYLFDSLGAETYYVKLNNGIPSNMSSSTGSGTDGTMTNTFEPGAMTDGDTNNDDDGTQMIEDSTLMVISDTLQLFKNTEPTNDDDTDNNSNLSVDFGLIRLLSVGNLVWEDLNNDGLISSGESGIQGVEVILYKDGGDNQTNTVDDIEIARLTTDIDGKYLFEDLYPGDYFVKLINGIPYNMVSSTGEGIHLITGQGNYEPAPDPDLTDDTDDNGNQMGTMINSDLVSLHIFDEPIDDEDTNENTNTTVDFGLIRKLDIGGLAWFDRTNDGRIDSGEEGMTGIEVILCKPGPDGIIGTADDLEVATTVTNENGDYNFLNLFPDKYFVKLINIPTYVASSDGTGYGSYSENGSVEPAIDPNNNVDSDDNGTQMGESIVITDVIDLVLYNEPTNDSDTLNFTNTSIDFALAPLHFARIFDPCNCLSNESGQAVGDGQFTDEITILSTRENQTWSLIANSGVYSINSLAPPAVPIVMPLGTIATPDGREDGFYRYVLRIKHIDSQGYSATFASDNGELTISNYCEYEGSCKYEVVTSTDGTPQIELSEGQNFIVGITNSPYSDTLLMCNDKSEFMDDGLVDGLYQDSIARNNLYTICPQTQWQLLQFNFTEFGTADGDVLRVYDGKNIGAPLIGNYTGEGVSQTGGWVASNCDPKVNPTGCLTFRFTTNGDNKKSNGWHANIVCSDREINLMPPNNLNAKLDCEEIFADLTINPVTVASACGAIQDSQIIRIFNENSELCLDTCLASTDNIKEKFAIGTYLIEYKLKSDTTKYTQSVVTVQGATLVCNDEVTIPLGSTCGIQLTPDDLLENTCDTITDSLYYYITLIGVDRNGNEKVLATGGGKEGNYPNLTKDFISPCGSSVTAKIEKRYYEGLNLSYCNNGPKSLNCEVKVNVIDQSSPWFSSTLPSDTFKLCAIELTEKGLGLTRPEAIDNCSETNVEFKSATLIDGGNDCDTTRVNVVWKASDECGNSQDREQLIVIFRPSLEDILKTSNTVFSCSENLVKDFDDITKTGIPGIKVGRVKNGILLPTDTLFLDTVNFTCGYILQKRDIQVVADCSIKLFRYWDVLDWCATDGNPMPIDTQFIELKDTLAPNFDVDSLAPLSIVLGHNECSIDITKLETPVATDNCSLVDVRMDKVCRIENGKKWVIPTTQFSQLDRDSFEIRWVAADACKEQKKEDTLTQIILIEDKTKPSPVCVDRIRLSLGENETRLHYTDIEGGSYDACGITKYEVSRDELNWDSIVVFSCEDVFQDIKVYLRVTDKNGNQNTCWMVVEPEDKIAPICSDLPTQTLFCDESHIEDYGQSTDADKDDLMEEEEWTPMTPEQEYLFNQEFGFPNCSDNLSCIALSIEQEYQFIEKNCGIALIKRRYRATDWIEEGKTSNWAEQQIDVIYKADWAVTFPADWKGTCGEEIASTEVDIKNGKCDQLTYEIEEQVFTIIEDACQKVVRTITIINWCNYETGQQTILIPRPENEHGMVTAPVTISNEDYENIGKIQYIQILKLQDETVPEITVNPVETCITGTECSEIKTFSAIAKDCNDAANELLRYSWLLKSHGMEIASGQGKTFDAEVKAEQTYETIWQVVDNCGNSTKISTTYEFTDCKKPSPYCLNGVAVDLMQDVGMVQVWASDIERGSSDNCTIKEDLSVRIWHASLGAAPTTIEEVQALPQVITFTCKQLGTQNVQFYTIDKAGNWDYCSTYVLIQDNTNACKDIESTRDKALVSGTIMDRKGQTINRVETTAKSTTTTLNYETQEDGQYHFELAKGDTYSITPSKNINPLNGVSTFDIVLISKHILGITTFDNPYQYIAADINKSESITAFDMVQLRRLILNIDQEFNNNTSWRFVDAAFEFVSENSLTEPYPEMVEISNLNTTMKKDFVAIKIGDINGNANSNRHMVSEERTSEKSLRISTQEQVLEAGKSYEVTFNIKQLATIQGYQFTLKFDGLKLNKINPLIGEQGNFGVHRIGEGVLMTSWNKQTYDEDPTVEKAPKVDIFTLSFTATKNGRLSEQLTIANRPTQEEAYDSNGHLMNVELAFDTRSTKQFELHQNQPNPFREKTTIGFYLPLDSPVELILKDASGRTIKVVKQEGKAGYNKIVTENIPTNGIIYYQLTTKFGSKIHKMLRLK